MAYIKFKDFKGLGTSYDVEDLNISYFDTYLNLKTRNKYVEMDPKEFKQWTTTTNSDGIPTELYQIPNLSKIIELSTTFNDATRGVYSVAVDNANEWTYNIYVPEIRTDTINLKFMSKNAYLSDSGSTSDPGYYVNIDMSDTVRLYYYDGVNSTFIKGYSSSPLINNDWNIIRISAVLVGSQYDINITFNNNVINASHTPTTIENNYHGLHSRTAGVKIKTLIIDGVEYNRLGNYYLDGVLGVTETGPYFETKLTSPNTLMYVNETDKYNLFNYKVTWTPGQEIWAIYNSDNLTLSHSGGDNKFMRYLKIDSSGNVTFNTHDNVTDTVDASFSLTAGSTNYITFTRVNSGTLYIKVHNGTTEELKYFNISATDPGIYSGIGYVSGTGNITISKLSTPNNSVTNPNTECNFTTSNYTNNIIGIGKYGFLSWEWEKAIITTLSSDKFSNSSASNETECLIMVGKSTDTEPGFTARQIWLNELGTTNWYEMTTSGNYTPTTGNLALGPEYLYTNIDGDVKLVGTQGAVKIYMPHDSFWLGKIDRTIQLPPSASSTTFSYTGYYLDRLVEPKNGIHPIITNPEDSTPLNPRIDIGTSYEVVTDASVSLKSISCSMQDIHAYDCTRLPYEQHLNLAHMVDTNGNIIMPVVYPTRANFPCMDNILPGEHIFIKYNSTGAGGGTFMVSKNTDSDKNFADYFVPKKDSSTTAGWDTTNIPSLASLTDPTTEDGIYYGGEWYSFEWGDIVGSTFSWEYTGYKNIGDDGFTATVDEARIITTAILDDESEIIVNYQPVDINSPSNTYALNTTINYTSSINHRVTQFNFYIKFSSDTEADYELVKTLKILKSEGDDFIDWDNIYLAKTFLEGTQLSQNIMFKFDAEKEQDYKIITGYNDIVTLNGISLAIIPGDTVNAFYSIVGRGVLQPDIIYKATRLKDVSIPKITSINEANNFFIVTTNYQTHILKATGISGQIAWSSIKSLEDGALSKDLAVEIRGGVIIADENGIFITDGYKKQSISELINDQLRVGGITSADKLFYSPKEHSVYWWDGTSKSISFLQRFSIDTKSWETLLPNSPGTNPDFTKTKDIFNDLDGNICLLEDDTVWMDNTGAGIIRPIPTITSHNVSINSSEEWKKIGEIYIDLYTKGTIGNTGGTFYVYLDNTQVLAETIEIKSARQVIKTRIPLDKNYPFRKFYWKFQASSLLEDFKIYEVSFELLPIWPITARDGETNET